MEEGSLFNPKAGFVELTEEDPEYLMMQEADEHVLEALQTLGGDRAALLERAERAHALRRGDAIDAVLAQCADVLGDKTLDGAAT